MSKAEPINQHWVPRFYLNHFAVSGSTAKKSRQVNVLRKPVGIGNSFTTATENVCGKRYLYTPLNDDGTRDRTLDNLFDIFETKGADVWTELKRDIRFAQNNGVDAFLALFAAMMHLRNVKMVDLIQSTIDLRNKLYGTPSIEENDNRADGVLDLRNSGKAFIQFVSEQIGKSAKDYQSKNWAFLVSDEGGFVTSDRPVSTCGKFMINGRLHTEGPITIFPLLPTAAIVMSDEILGGDRRLIVADSGLVRFANSLVNSGSLNFLITGRSPNEVIHELLNSD